MAPADSSPGLSPPELALLLVFSIAFFLLFILYFLKSCSLQSGTHICFPLDTSLDLQFGLLNLLGAPFPPTRPRTPSLISNPDIPRGVLLCPNLVVLEPLSPVC